MANTFFKNTISMASLILDKDLAAVRNLILEKVENEVLLIPEISKHIISSGGKRIRPILTLLSSKMFSYEGNKDIILSACVEFIHTATLLHDDVLDENMTRRGNHTPNHIWGNKPAILVGDYLFAKSFELMVETESLEILSLLSKTSSILVSGEILQLSSINNLNVDEETYLKIIFAKTASLFSSATEAGAILAGANLDYKDNIKEYAINLGKAFQIVDDILDYSSSQESLGKTIGTDFNECKVTLPIILLMQSCSNEEKKFLEKTFTNAKKDDGDFEQLLHYINKYNCLELSLDIAHRFCKHARLHIEKVSLDNQYKEIFMSMVNTSVNRKF